MTTTVERAAELALLLRDNSRAADRRRVRLRGRGTRPHLVPAPPPDTLHVSLARLATIERLEADDLTCSVAPGVGCRELAAALAAQHLELGCLRADDDGTIGGLFAADPTGQETPGSPCPRSTLLGLDGVLADGTEFRSGARVVKSVAGFDVHRLLVGSLGRLFAATLLHIKLRPAPQARATFVTAPLEFDAALQQLVQWRGLPVSPRRLLLRGTNQVAVLHGELVGRASAVAAALRAHGLRGDAPLPPAHLPAPAAERELVHGRTRIGAFAALARSLPEDTPMSLSAGGHFEVELLPAATDALLAGAAAFGAEVAIAAAAPGRLGRHSDRDPAAAALQRRLLQALDPAEVLV